MASIHFKPTILGRLTQAATRSPELQIVIKFDDGTSQTTRITEPMAASGFLLNPLPKITADIATIVEGKPIRRVQSLSLHSTQSQQRAYLPSITIEFESFKLMD